MKSIITWSVLILISIGNSYASTEKELQESLEENLKTLSILKPGSSEFENQFNSYTKTRNAFLSSYSDKKIEVLADLLAKYINTPEKIISYIKISDKPILSLVNQSSANVVLSKICIPRKHTQIDVFFINGMFNGGDSPEISLSAIKTLIPEAIKQIKKKEGFNPKVNYFLLRNESEFFLTQLAQVFINKMKDNYGTFWQYLYLLEKAPPSFKKDYFDTMASFLKSKNVSVLNDKIGNIFFDQVKNSIENGNIPIIISHSQGNFYANYISRKLKIFYNAPIEDDPEKYWGNIQIASPTWSSDSQYGKSFLRDDDIVIAKMVETLAKSSDVTEKNRPKVEFSGHELIKSYLNDDIIRNKIIRSTSETFSNLRTKGFYEDHGLINYRLKDKCKYITFYENNDSENCIGEGSIPCHCLKEGKYVVEISAYNQEELECNSKLEFKTSKSYSTLDISLKFKIKNSSEEKKFNMNIKYQDKGLIFELE